MDDKLLAVEEKNKVYLWDLIAALAKVVDLLSPVIANHNIQTAYIALSIASDLALSSEDQNDLSMAGVLHDVGALSLADKLYDASTFELTDPGKHAEIGFLFLQRFPPLSRVATLIRYHHTFWNDGAGSEFNGQQVPIGSHILHLADRVDVSINRDEEILGQRSRISSRILDNKGKMFMPEVVDAFQRISEKELFWLEITDPSVDEILRDRVRLGSGVLDPDNIYHMTELIAQIIDFRSKFTSTHSSGVAAVAEALYRLSGFQESECLKMKIAGYVHDLGKLAVPIEILEKTGKLTENEWNIIRRHTYHTYNALKSITSLSDISEWASFHHERSDGKGYPFHLKDRRLSSATKIVAVADVFTALMEERPYRKSVPVDEALRIVERMARDSDLDSKIVSLLKAHVDDVNQVRCDAENLAAKNYQELMQQV